MLFFTQKSSGLKETNRDVLYPASLGKITQIEKFVFEEGGSFRVECQNGGVRADGRYVFLLCPKKIVFSPGKTNSLSFKREGRSSHFKMK